MAWALLLLVVVAVDRLMCWHTYRQVHDFGYGVQDGGLPFGWQDNIGIYLLFEPSCELLWSYRPSIDLRLRLAPRFGAARVYTFRSNSMGLREREFAREKPLGHVRVFCMGDSCTAGCGLALERAYPRRLQGMLRQRLRNEQIDVFNAGTDGYTSFQGKRLLESKLLAFSPDVLIVASSSNDDSPRPRSDADAQRHLCRTAVSVQRILLKSPLLMMLARPILAAKRRMATVRSQGPVQNATRVSKPEYAQNLAELCDMANARSVQVVLLSLPRYVRGQMEACHHAGAMARVAREQHARFVDMLPVFVARRRDGPLLHFDWVHPNERGHELIAESLAACLYHLLWHGVLAMDWQQLLFDDAVPHPDATVWLPQTGGAS